MTIHTQGGAMTEKEFYRVILLASLVCGIIVAWLAGGSFRVAMIVTGVALIVLSVATRLVIESATIVPKVHYGVVLRWGQQRIGRTILDTDGLRWVWPFIDKVDCFNYQQDIKSIDFGAFSADKLMVIGDTLVQWRPNRKSMTLEGKNKFMENKKETIEDGISGAIKSVIEKIIGSVDAEVFRGMRGAVELYLRCALQLKEPPHVHPWKISNKYLPNSGEIMGIEERLKFYRENSGKINDKLREVNAGESYSEIEEQYGIDISMFKVKKVDFSPATNASLEKEKQAEAAMEGAKKLRATFLETIKEIIATSPDLDSEVVLNAALVVTGQAKKDIHSVEGFKNLFKSADGKLILPEFLKGGKK